MQKFVLAYCYSKKWATSRIWKVLPTMVFTDLGLKMAAFWACACKLSWTRFSPAPFSSPEPRILLACGRNRELWEQPFWNNKGNNRIPPIRFNSVFIYGACPKWLLPELSIPAAGQKDRRLWGRECARPGSVPSGGGKKGEFRDWTKAVIVLWLGGIVSVVWSIVLSKRSKQFMWDLTSAPTWRSRIPMSWNVNNPWYRTKEKRTRKTMKAKGSWSGALLERAPPPPPVSTLKTSTTKRI